ncbi:MAG: hypothetical protein U0802_12195 [Candidatus Binatia bacterium]
MAFLENLLALFSNDIEVDLSPQAVVVRCGARSVSLRPVVHLSTATPPKVLAVGDAPGFTEPHQCVELFRPTPHLGAAVSKGACLEAFFTYAVHCVVSSRVLVRPRMIVFGVSSLRDVFGGYEEWVFAEVLAKAGARACEFRSGVNP